MDRKRLTNYTAVDGSSVLVEVWFDLRKGGRICLPRITQPEAQHQLILHHLGWSLPEQPAPKIYRDQNQFVWTT